MTQDGRFVIVFEFPSGKVGAMTDEGEAVSVFSSAAEARATGERMAWANAWVWWVVELADLGRVQFGPEAL